MARDTSFRIVIIFGARRLWQWMKHPVTEYMEHDVQKRVLRNSTFKETQKK